MESILQQLIAYRSFIDVLTYTALFFVILIIVIGFYDKYMIIMDNNKPIYESENLKNIDFEKVSENDRASVIRRLVAPNGVDPNLNSYLIIEDAGREVYIRSFTIERLPKMTQFAKTFSALLNNDRTTGSIFIQPLTEEDTIAAFDKRLVHIDAEYGLAGEKDDKNRQRKLRAKYHEAEAWQSDVESGETKFYRVGYLFSIRADTLEELNKKSDEFNALAKSMYMQLASCYGVQSEAYISNLPLNKSFKLGNAAISSDAVKYHILDQAGVSTIYNHTQSDFYHKNGIPLGINMETLRIVSLDTFDPSHDGFSMAIAGKTGAGKSASVKQMVCRYNTLYGLVFCAVDSQARGSVGEYAAGAYALGGVNIQIKANSDIVLNFFEVSETYKMLTDDKSKGAEIVTLEVKEKIADDVNILLSIVRGDEEKVEFRDSVYIEEVITELVSELYDDYKIYDGDVDSIYEYANLYVNGTITTGRVKKKQPTMTCFFKKLLTTSKRIDREERYIDACKIVLSRIKNYVRELYYSNETITYFTRSEYEALPKDSSGRTYFVNAEGVTETVEKIMGFRAYYDGQSNVEIDRNSPFTNIDISQLPEAEKRRARQIAMSFLNEHFVKKNSDNFNSIRKMVLILDECHENFNDPYCRKTIDNVIRTARKRNVGVWMITQNLTDYDYYKETRDMLKQCAIKMVFKQDSSDREHIKKVLDLTDSQVNKLLDLGGTGDISDLSNPNARRGECCIVDNKKVAFCKVEYEFFKEIEEYVVETSSDGIKKLYGKKSA